MFQGFKQILFGEHYSALFHDFNQNILVPKPAHDALLNTIYGAAGAEFMAGLLSDGVLGCPDTGDKKKSKTKILLNVINKNNNNNKYRLMIDC